MTSIISYNVNGIRSAAKKGVFDWFNQNDPDIILLQEIKAWPDQLDSDMINYRDYKSYWHEATRRKGYSGVAIYTKQEPLHVEYGCGMEKYDEEGRILRADFEDFSVMSVYFPSGTTGDIRQDFKEEFMADFQQYINELKKDIPNLVIGGDYNICHKPIDIHNPVSNKNSSGFLPHEREWVSQFLDSGFKDSFRMFHEDEPDHYSWWSFRANSRANNKGWRIDYNMVSDPLASRVQSATIHPDAVHSDHCPIEVVIS